MSYFMRYIARTTVPTLTEIGASLHEANSGYYLAIDPEDESVGDLYLNDDLLGEIGVNLRGDEVGDEDLADLLDELTKQDSPNAARARDLIRSAAGLVAVHVLEAAHQHPERLEPLWRWLFAHYDGALQIDEDGIYDGENRLIVGLLF